MRLRILFGVICCFFWMSGTGFARDVLDFTALAGLSLTGKVSVTGSYAAVNGNAAGFQVQELVLPGLDYTYLAELVLDGQVGDFYLESYLYFPEAAKPELELLLESPDWLLLSSTFELKLPALQTSFGTQKLDGVQLSRRNNSLHLFYGTKAYQSRHATFTVLDEGQLVYTLFDSTAGDMVENSEIVFLQGKRLDRYIDYKVNFLSGQITFLVPLRSSSLIEVHYNYIPTGSPVKDRLLGGYFQANYGQSYASVFYFDDTTVTPADAFFDTPDAPDTVLTHRYIGSAVNLVGTCLNLSGELALTKSSLETTDYAGNIHLVYTTPTASVDYLLTTATPGYEGVGVVPVTAGETHTLTGEYQFTPAFYLDWQLARMKKSTDWSDSLTRTAQTGAHYRITDYHTLSLSFDASALTEWKETTAVTDIMAGWQYAIGEHSSVSYENSLRYPAKNRLAFQLNTYPLRLQSEYKQYPEHVPFLGEYWVREFTSDWVWRPYTGVSLTGDIDYSQPFTDTFQNSRRRLALTLLAAPDPRLSVRSNYIYYYNPTLHSRTLFYDLATTLQLPYNLQLDAGAEKIEIRSPVLTNTDQSWNGTLTRQITDRWKTSLSQSQDEKRVFLKSIDSVYQHDNTVQRTLSAIYQVNEPLSLNASITDLRETHFLGDTTSTTTETGLSLVANYSLEQNIGHYEISYLRKNLDNLLKHRLSWSNHPGSWQYGYTGELTHQVQQWKILHLKQALKVSWQHENSPYQPSGQLSYLKKDDEGQMWEKFSASVHCAYRFTDSHLLFAELGHTGSIDYQEPGKSYWATFLKTGVEYSF